MAGRAAAMESRWHERYCTGVCVCVRARKRAHVQSDKVKLIADGIGGVRRLLAAAALGEHVVASVHRLLQYARTLDYAELPDYTLLIPVIFIISPVCHVYRLSTLH
jgi:hypothetical protein